MIYLCFPQTIPPVAVASRRALQRWVDTPGNQALILFDAPRAHFRGPGTAPFRSTEIEGANELPSSSLLLVENAGSPGTPARFTVGHGLDGGGARWQEGTVEPLNRRQSHQVSMG